ncbi:MAG: M20/M25/M40 family metallo-hydrolase, partial [Planctomycetota bacterium]
MAGSSDTGKHILKEARRHKKAMVAFLRDLVAIPSESAQERQVIKRIRTEMEHVGGFDRIYTDRMGNLFGRIGKGRPLIAVDAHVDTVGIGDPDEWKHDPYRGKVAGGKVFGRGAGDQEGAIPAMVYAGRIIRDLGLHTGPGAPALLMCFTVMEED